MNELTDLSEGEGGGGGGGGEGEGGEERAPRRTTVASAAAAVSSSLSLLDPPDDPTIAAVIHSYLKSPFIEERVKATEVCLNLPNRIVDSRRRREKGEIEGTGAVG